MGGGRRVSQNHGGIVGFDLNLNFLGFMFCLFFESWNERRLVIIERV